MACPTCGGMFANNTKFFDHIRRQTALERKPRGQGGAGGSWAGVFGWLELSVPCEPRAGCAWSSLACLLSGGSYRIPE